MTAQTRYSRAARDDLIAIWSYIAIDDPAAADRQIDRIEAAIAQLREFPEIGHAREDAGAGVKLVLQDQYLVIYRHDPAKALVTIERVVHGRRNLDGMIG